MQIFIHKAGKITEIAVGWNDVKKRTYNVIARQFARAGDGNPPLKNRLEEVSKSCF